MGRGATHFVRRFLHPLGEALALQVAGRITRRHLCILVGVLTASCSGPGRLLLERVLQALHAIGKAILLAGQAPHRVLGRIAGAALRELAGNLSLRVGQLAAFELHVSQGAAPVVTAGSSRGLHLLLEIA